MTTERKTTRHVRCPKCSIPQIKKMVWAEITDWRPPHGIDPQVRQFQCECGWTVYTRPAILERDRV